MKFNDISDDQLLLIVAKTDAQCYREGINIKARAWEVPKRVMKQFGFISFVMGGIGKPPIMERIETAFGSIYRQ
jgi:hypothetical protein